MLVVLAQRLLRALQLVLVAVGGLWSLFARGALARDGLACAPQRLLRVGLAAAML